MAKVNSIQINDLKVNFGGESSGCKLCNSCAWKITCHPELLINQLTVKTMAGEISIRVEIKKCSYFLSQTSENKELTNMEDMKICQKQKK